MKIVYIVICPCNNNDECYHIDSVWTSERKAQKKVRAFKQKRKRKFRRIWLWIFLCRM